MEKHLIESYYKWVYSKLYPFLLLQAGSEKVKAYLVTSKELKEALKTQLLRDSLDNKTEIEMSFLIQRCQCTVVILLDHLFHHGRHELITRELKAFYGEVAADLEEIISFLQNTWGCYFNANQNLPLSHWVSEGCEVKRQWKEIAKTLTKSEENIRLVKILDRCIKDLLYPAKGQAITYRRLSWLKNLFTELSGHLSTTALGYASLTELLISWNFNDRTFISEVCNNIMSEAETKESDECRIEYLRAYSKQVEQVLEKVREPFYPALAAKRMIRDWLAKELDYLELINIVMETKGFKEGAKIHTSLSVPELALIIRLFKDSGIFTNPKETEILKFFAAHFTTKRNSDFSYNYLHSEYCQVNKSTKKKVYDYLMAMAQLCKETVGFPG
jgi:hypothetical protein